MIITSDIYENTLIDAFMLLFAREHGARFGKREFNPFGFNLLQQTQLDKPLGDVVISQKSFVRLIEFKRRRSRSKKEQTKLSSLKTAISGRENAELVTISRQIHWYVETDYTQARKSIVVPYLDLEHPDGTRTIERFIEEIAAAMDGPGMTDPEMLAVRRYLQAVAAFAGDKDNSEPATESGGLVIVSEGSSGSGGLGTRLFPIQDVRQLAMRPNQVFAEVEAWLKQEIKQHMQPEQALRVEQRPEPPTMRHSPGLRF
jgi:hypothetical protein